MFTRQFATMINAGLPLVQCLEILSAQMANERLTAGQGRDAVRLQLPVEVDEEEHGRKSLRGP